MSFPVSRQVLRSASFWRNAVIGAIVAALYVMLDEYLDDQSRLAPLPTILEWLHAALDIVVPIAGAAGAVITNLYFDTRRQLSETQARAAENMKLRLERIERDQAVWLLAASSLPKIATPLHTLGLLYDELSDLREGASDERRHLLGQSRAQIDRMKAALSLLKNVPEAAAPTLTPLRLSDCLNDAVARIANIAAEQGVKLDVATLPSIAVLADQRSLNVIIENLLENGINAARTTGEGRVVVSVEAHDTRLRVDVEDNGPGFNPEVAGQLFEPLGASNRHHLGLGLSISRSLARAMKAELTHRSPGALGGARFSLELSVAT